MHLKEIADRAVLEQRAIQKPSELVALLALVADLEPKIIVEIGSDAGGTLWAWQQLCPRVIGIDMPNGPFGSPVVLNSHGCEIILGDSHDPATVKQLRTVLGRHQPDMVFIDGDHRFEGVKADYELYSPLVRPGGIVVLHDVCQHPNMPFVEVNRFWATLGGDKEEIVTPPYTWGGIGVIRVPALVGASKGEHNGSS